MWHKVYWFTLNFSHFLWRKSSLFKENIRVSLLLTILELDPDPICSLLFFTVAFNSLMTGPQFICLAIWWLIWIWLMLTWITVVHSWLSEKVGLVVTSKKAKCIMIFCVLCTNQLHLCTKYFKEIPEYKEVSFNLINLLIIIITFQLVWIVFIFRQ